MVSQHYLALAYSDELAQFSEVADQSQRSHEHLFNANLKEYAIFGNDGNEAVVHGNDGFLGGDVGHA